MKKKTFNLLVFSLFLSILTIFFYKNKKNIKNNHKKQTNKIHNKTKKDYVIVMIGDSITAGYGLEEKYSYPQIVEEKLNKIKDNIKIINSSISGSTTASGLSRLKWVISYNKPTHMFLALGANDGLRGLPISSIEKNLSQIVEEAQKNSIKVLLSGMMVPPNLGKKYSKEF